MRSKILKLLLELIRDVRLSCSSQSIGFGCIFEKKNILLKENLSFYHKEMDLSKFFECIDDNVSKIDLPGEYGDRLGFEVEPFSRGREWYESRSRNFHTSRSNYKDEIQEVTASFNPSYLSYGKLVKGNSRRCCSHSLPIVQNWASRRRCIKGIINHLE